MAEYQKRENHVGDDFSSAIKRGRSAVNKVQHGTEKLKQAKQAANTVRGAATSAQAAKTAAKIAAQASSGNVAGAALEAVKNVDSLTQLVKGVVVGVFLPLFLAVALLASVPGAIFQAVGNFFGSLFRFGSSGVYTDWEDYPGNWDVSPEYLEDLRNRDDTPENWDIDPDEYAKKIEIKTLDELIEDMTRVIEDEGAMLREMSRQAESVRNRLNRRTGDIVAVLEKSAQDGAIHSYFKAKCENEYPDATFGGVTITVNAGTLSDYDAAVLLSIYSVQCNATEGGILGSDILEWLGNPDVPSGNTLTFYVGGIDEPFTIDAWSGVCLPQYIQEEFTERMRVLADEYEQESAGGLDRVEAFAKAAEDIRGEYVKYCCAAADLLIQLDCDVNLAQVMIEEEIEEVEVPAEPTDPQDPIPPPTRPSPTAPVPLSFKVSVGTELRNTVPLTAVMPDTPGDTTPSDPTDEDDEEAQTVEVVHRTVYYTLNANIHIRNAEQLSTILGLWDGPLEVERPEGGAGA